MPKFYSCAAREDNPNIPVGIVELTSEQYEFIQVLAQCRGDLNKAFALMPCSMGVKQGWAKDRVFWPAVRALQAQIARAKHLTEDFVRDRMIAVANGEMPVSKQQMQAINMSARILGMGLAQNHQQGKVSIRPEEITVEFGDALAGPAESLTLPQPEPLPDLIEDNSEDTNPR